MKDTHQDTLLGRWWGIRHVQIKVVAMSPVIVLLVHEHQLLHLDPVLLALNSPRIELRGLDGLGGADGLHLSNNLLLVRCVLPSYGVHFCH